jgi:hypothetical protein
MQSFAGSLARALAVVGLLCLVGCDDSGTIGGPPGAVDAVGAGGSNAPSGTGAGDGGSGASGGASGGGSLGGSGVGDGPGLEFALMPLQLLQPHAAGSPGMGPAGGLDPKNRIFRAYPGLRYEIDVVAIGGAQPPELATVSLANAPAGMVAERYTAASGARLWRVVWPNPTATASDVVLTYTDRNGNVDTATWSVTVGTAGFKFVDGSAGSNGTGTAETPFSAPGGSLANAKAGCDGAEILYLRGGTYHVNADPGTSGAFTADIWESNETCVQWIAYPGEVVIVDGGYAGNGVDVAMLAVNFEGSGAPAYFDGMTFRDFKDKTFYIGGGNGAYEFGIRHVVFDGQGPGTGGNNSATITFPASFSEDARRRGFFVSNTWRNIDGTENCLAKFYTVGHFANHGNLVESVGAGNEGFAYKSDVELVSEVANANGPEADCMMTSGNQHDQVGRRFSGEVAFNNYQREDHAEKPVLRFNQDGMSAEVNVFNNTIRGRILLQNATDGDGPIHFLRNAIVNSQGAQAPWPCIDAPDASDVSVATQTDELLGADLDADGNLQGEDLANHGPAADPADRRGHMTH